MRLTEFYELVLAEFGQVYGDSLLRDHALLAVSGKTALQAIEAGHEPREVWRALCADFDIPRERW
ncbi:MAG: DUF3046 domain-containing protein [Mycobacteriaceae bacterium]